jgi:hypothetical protein
MKVEDKVAERPTEQEIPFEQTVPDGTPLNVAVSALIKSLRRGRELEALYWAKQIESGYWAYLWRRLLIFASEDVNIGNPDAVVQVRALYENYATLKEYLKTSKSRQQVDRSVLTMAVMVLARSPKSREVDDLLNVIEHLTGQFGWKPTVRDEVYDLHTRIGKSRWPNKFRLRQWLESASREENRVGPLDWHLWLYKWGAQRGIYAIEFVEELADRWEKGGRLRHGTEGVIAGRFDWKNVKPEFADVMPASPRIGLDAMPVDVWVWHCTTCNCPRDRCVMRSCCQDCDHEEIR